MGGAGWVRGGGGGPDFWTKVPASPQLINEANQTFAVWMRGHEEALVNPLVSL